MKTAFDHTAYHGSAPSIESPDRPATKLELATWMNNFTHSLGTNLYHWVTEGMIHWANRSQDPDTGDWTHEIYEWGVL
jgi:hypothetical protein